MEKLNNPPAFPLTDGKSFCENGMTLRDYFAAKALQSYMINCEAIKVNDGYIAISEIGNLAEYSYQTADAMLKERSKNPL